MGCTLGWILGLYTDRDKQAGKGEARKKTCQELSDKSPDQRLTARNLIITTEAVLRRTYNVGAVEQMRANFKPKGLKVTSRSSIL